MLIKRDSLNYELPQNIKKSIKIEVVGAQICMQFYEKAIIIALAHNEFRSIDFNAIKAAGDTVLFDTKGFLDRGVVDGRL